MTAEPAAFGILLIDKPRGPTSHDVVGWVRWALRERAVGHCGTLDPPAEGLLVVCVGAATKLVDHLTGVDKRYRARFVLGRSTTTADAEGETVETAPVPASMQARALECMQGLVGALELPPPAVSAVRVDGRRAHALVRAGEAPSLPPRPMTVRTLQVLGHGHADQQLWIDAELCVTKGTYIRSLAEELGRRLGLPAHMASLRRLACGALSVDDPAIVAGLVAEQLDAREGLPPKWRIQPAGDDSGGREQAAELLRARMSPPWTRLPFAVGHTGPAARPLIRRLIQGQRLRADEETLITLGLPRTQAPGTCAVVDRAGGHLIIIAQQDGRLAPTRVMRFDAQQWPERPPDH